MMHAGAFYPIGLSYVLECSQVSPVTGTESVCYVQGVPVKYESKSIFLMHCHGSPEQHTVTGNGYEIFKNKELCFDH